AALLVAVAVTVPAPPDIFPLSLHDALPISPAVVEGLDRLRFVAPRRIRSRAPSLRCLGHGGTIAASENKARTLGATGGSSAMARSEEHTSELQSRENLVCRLLLEKKNKKKI